MQGLRHLPARCGTVIPQGDHGLHLPGLCGLFPHPPGLGLILPGTPAIIQAVPQGRKRLCAARLGGGSVACRRFLPIPGPGGCVPGFQLLSAGVVASPLRFQQPAEQGDIQRGRACPRIQHHTIDAVRFQRILHGAAQAALHHGPGGAGLFRLGVLYRSEQRQIVPLFPGVEQPGRQALGPILRDGQVCPGSGPALGVHRRIQRHQYLGLQFQRIVQGVHQAPEMFLVLLPVQPRHGLLHKRAACAHRPVLRRSPLFSAAHRPEAPTAHVVCHLPHPSFSSIG